MVWFSLPTWLVIFTFAGRLGSPMISVFSVGVWPGGSRRLVSMTGIEVEDGKGSDTEAFGEFNRELARGRRGHYARHSYKY